MTTYKIARAPWREQLSGCVVLDKDSTIADTRHRHWMLDEIKAGKLTWDDYSLAAAVDAPMPGTVQLMRLLEPSYRLVVITGASDTASGQVLDWFDKHQIRVDELRMRPSGNSTPNGEFKVAEIKALQRDYEVKLVIEDWIDAVTYITGHTGLPVLGVNPFYEYGADVPRVPGTDVSRAEGL
jgi:hypothetical protein